MTNQAKKEQKKVKIDLKAVLPEFLRKKIEEHGNKDIFLYDGPTHGCIAHGIAITFSQEQNALFFEAPKSAVSW